MSVRNALLALLEQGPRYGYQLRAEFEHRTGGTWPLNVGQVYTTLARLERDGLVEPARGPTARATSSTRSPTPAATRWPPGSPPRSPRTQPPRDELAIKLALAVTVPGRRRRHGDPAAAHRHHGRAAGLHPAQAPAPTGDDADELAWGLVLDSLVFAAEAEIRWLDHCEARLRRAAAAPARPTPRRRRGRADVETEEAQR